MSAPVNLVNLNGISPKLGSDCFIAPNAFLIGDVVLGSNCSIWYNVTIRGDVMPIRIGDEVNIQDGSVLHGTYGKFACTLERRVTIGHQVILHGCHIGEQSLIGMGSTIMDGAKISQNSLVGAGSLVVEGSHFPEGVLIIGRPAKVKRQLTHEEIESLSLSADNYLLYKSWYK